MASRKLDKFRILVVEDEYLIADDIAETIRQNGGEVLGPCSSIESARELLAETGQLPHGAILDLNLKGMPVSGLARELNEASVPIVYHTGYDANCASEGLPRGSIVMKPASRDDLVRQVAAAISRMRSGR